MVSIGGGRKEFRTAITRGPTKKGSGFIKEDGPRLLAVPQVGEGGPTNHLFDSKDSYCNTFSISACHIRHALFFCP